MLFYHWLSKEVYESCLLPFKASLALSDFLFHNCQLNAFFVNDFDPEIKVFNTEIFPQHTMVDWKSDTTFVLFNQKKPLG